MLRCGRARAPGEAEPRGAHQAPTGPATSPQPRMLVQFTPSIRPVRHLHLSVKVGSRAETAEALRTSQRGSRDLSVSPSQRLACWRLYPTYLEHCAVPIPPELMTLLVRLWTLANLPWTSCYPASSPKPSRPRAPAQARLGIPRRRHSPQGRSPPVRSASSVKTIRDPCAWRRCRVWASPRGRRAAWNPS